MRTGRKIVVLAAALVMTGFDEFSKSLHEAIRIVERQEKKVAQRFNPPDQAKKRNDPSNQMKE
jgi:hypothetical protein